MRVILTICSKEKDSRVGDLPASKRYKSARITKVGTIAKRKGLPLFILSGKYGLVAGDDNIPYYDHLLTQDEVVEMAALVARQTKHIGITEIELYAKAKQGSWTSYYEVIERVATEQGVKLEIVTI
jgi:hypothetical protein